jgi:hypothetical protein
VKLPKLIPSKYRKSKLAIAAGAGIVASWWLAPVYAVGIGVAALAGVNWLDDEKK